MVKLLHIAIIVIVIFVLTYDPKSGTLDNIINDPAPKSANNNNKDQANCCEDPSCAAKNPEQCKDIRYGSLQFVDNVPSGFTTTNSSSWGGAILGP
jgi:hypothetical protein